MLVSAYPICVTGKVGTGGCKVGNFRLRKICDYMIEKKEVINNTHEISLELQNLPFAERDLFVFCWHREYCEWVVGINLLFRDCFVWGVAATDRFLWAKFSFIVRQMGRQSPSPPADTFLAASRPSQGCVALPRPGAAHVYEFLANYNLIKLSS